jgi:hypothetical protein
MFFLLAALAIGFCIMSICLDLAGYGYGGLIYAGTTAGLVGGAVLLSHRVPPAGGPTPQP